MSAARILVAHESEGIRAVIASVLGKAGFEVMVVGDGHACRAALEAAAWEALVLDVALSGVYAFELVPEARRAVPGARIVLVASVYNRTSYKRRPTSLHGADDYVEQHHIADSLVEKVRPQGAPTPGPAPADRRPGDAVRAAAAIDEAPSELEGEAGARRAERLALLIVGDIALYNAEAVAAARAAGREGRDRIEARLRADLEEGRLLFDSRVPRSVRAGRDFIGEALDDLLRGVR